MFDAELAAMPIPMLLVVEFFMTKFARAEFERS
jgi:hypothetical protein